MPALSAYRRYGQTTNPAPEKVSRKHTVIGGEEAPGIAAAEYRQGYDAELWRQVMEANEVDDLEADLTAGRTLKVPSPAPKAT